MKTQVIMSFIVVMLESLAMCAPAWAAATVPAIASETATYYVDAANGDDSNSGLSPDTAFATIQEGIDTTGDGDTVMVYPGIYTEGIRFRGKAITVQSATDGAVLQNPDDFAVAFYYGEGPDSVLKNFLIRNSLTGIFIAASSPTISNVTVVNNEYGVEAYGGAEPHISNSIIWDNTGADLIGCQASYSWVQQEVEPEPLEGLISHWKFDEASGTTAYDSAGNNHGTIHGAQWTTGAIGGALSFDGVDDYVEVPDDDSLTPSSEITISFWIYNRGGHHAGIYKWAACPERKGSPGYSRAYSLLIAEQTDRVASRVYSGPATYGQIDNNGIVSKNRWHHVALTFDRGNAAIYIDGQLDTSASMPVSSIMNDAQPLMIGGYWIYGGEKRFDKPLNGIMDELMIFDRALSAEDVQRLYENGLDGSGSVSNPLFADPANDDYHLLSERGRYWPEHDVWVLDKVTSPCIDGGDPDTDYSNEPKPNGGRINMGAYGGTAYASMSEMQWFDPDVNGDGVVDISDILELIDLWLEAAGWGK